MTKEFIEAVRKMRQFQKDYFNTRDPYTLCYAKKAEREVDKLLESIGQPSLFDAPEIQWRRVDKSLAAVPYTKNPAACLYTLEGEKCPVIGLSKDGIMQAIHNRMRVSGDGYYLNYDDLMKIPKEK